MLKNIFSQSSPKDFIYASIQSKRYDSGNFLLHEKTEKRTV